MKTRKLKKSAKLFILGFVIVIVSIIIGVNVIKDINYKKTYEYKLGVIGYDKGNIEIISTLEDSQIDYILTLENNDIIPKLISEKYFIYSNLDAYLTYYTKNSKLGVTNTVTMVNVKRNYEYYDKDVIKPTNINDGMLMLINKYNYLTTDYLPEDLTDISNKYAYSGHSLIKEAAEAYTKMAQAAAKEDIKLIATSTYRTYEKQSYLWESRSYLYGDSEADKYTARAGHSEHQTGLAVDITTSGISLDEFIDTDEYTWLIANCYKYGFILRYPEHKEDITGYGFESWHYRYIGIDAATKVNSLGITFDEYYAYFIDNK